MLPQGEAAGRAARWLALLVPLGLLGGAYVSQYGFGLYPCEMCWWQRYPHFAAIPLALLGIARPDLRWPTLLAALAIGISGAIGAFHAGVEYGWWEGLTACSTTASRPAGTSALDAIMNAPIVRCDVAPWTLLGVSLAGYNFLISGAAAVLIARLFGRGERT
jgi:disulfide bond formation protein DsbB